MCVSVGETGKADGMVCVAIVLCDGRAALFLCVTPLAICVRYVISGSPVPKNPYLVGSCTRWYYRNSVEDFSGDNGIPSLRRNRYGRHTNLVSNVR